MMRTTLTLDDDLLAKLRALAHRRGVSLREVVNETIRRGLSTPQGRSRSRGARRIQTFRSAFRPGVDPERLNQLADDLEVEDGSGTR